MLSIYDYIIIALYLLFLTSMGWIFRRFNKGSDDYFAAGFRMSWWLLGSSILITNVSCWLFTAGAEIAYNYGLLILGVYLNDVIGFLLAALWFAPRFRQMRVVTSIGAIRLRFDQFNEQFFNWIGMMVAFLQSAVGLVGLSIVLSTLFPLNQVGVIVTTGMVVLSIALVGGSWGMAASGFVQFTMLTCMTIVAGVLTIVHLGGVHTFVSQIPADHWQIFRPAGSIKYDWIYLVTGWLASAYWRNNLGVTGKYVAARDSAHARKAALVPLIGYLVLPLFWFIPPLAAFTLVPDLRQQFAAMAHPGEASYFAVCKLVLPQGLLGLMVAVMFSVTMGAMDAALNKNAALFVKNFYQSILRKNASDRELYAAGYIATFVCGLLTIGTALLLIGNGSVSLFDAYQYLNAYLWMPVGVTLILAMLVRNVPKWAGWSTVVFGALFSVFLYDVLPLPAFDRMLSPFLGERVYHYMISNKFAITNLIGIPVTSLFFLCTRFFYRRSRDKNYERQVRHFFRQMETPIDFEKEVGNDNTQTQARILGKVMAIYGVLISLILFVPNSITGRMAIAGCAGVMLTIAVALSLYARRLRQRDALRAAAPLPALGVKSA